MWCENMSMRKSGRRIVGGDLGGVGVRRGRPRTPGPVAGLAPIEGVLTGAPHFGRTGAAALWAGPERVHQVAVWHIYMVLKICGVPSAHADLRGAVEQA